MAQEPTLLDEITNEPIPSEEGPDPQARSQPNEAPGLPEVASFAGGMGGAQLGGPVVPARGAGAAVGAGSMYLAGKTSQDMRNGIPFSIQQFTENVVEAGKRGMLAGSAEMALPVAGQVLSATPGVKKGAEAVVGWMGKKLGEHVLTPLTQQGTRTEAIIKAGGGPGMTAGQTVQSEEEKSAVKIMENIAANAFTSKVANETRRLNVEAVTEYGKNWLSQMEKLPSEDVGNTMLSIIRGREDAFVRKPLDWAFGQLRDAVPGRVINATNQLKLLRNPNSKLGDIVSEGLRTLRESSGNVKEIDDLISMLGTPAKGTQTQFSPNLSLEQAFRLKTELTRLAGKPVTPSTPPETEAMIGAAGNIAHQLDGQIQKSLQHAPDLLNLYKTTNAYAQKVFEVFRGDLVKGVINQVEQRPGKLADILLKPQNQDTIEAVKMAVGTRWESEIQPLLAATVLRRGYNEVQDRFSGSMMETSLRRLREDTIDSAFTPGMHQKLLDFAKAVQHVEVGTKGAGGVLIQLAGAGAVGSIAGAGYAVITGDTKGGIAAGVGSASMILLTPWVFGHLVANPRLLDAMKTGLFEFKASGKPPTKLMTALRQAAATAGAPSLEAALTTEPGLKGGTPPRFTRGTGPELRSESTSSRK